MPFSGPLSLQNLGVGFPNAVLQYAPFENMIDEEVSYSQLTISMVIFLLGMPDVNLMVMKLKM